MIEICEMIEKNKRLQIVRYKTNEEEGEDQLHNNLESHQEHRLKEASAFEFPPLFAHNFSMIVGN